ALLPNRGGRSTVWRIQSGKSSNMSGNGNREQPIYVTLSGLPLRFDLQWPFHKSTSGSDFWVLHGDIRLEGSGGLHAPVSVNLSATVREVMPSLEPADAEAPVINALRKEVDRRQIEFLKSGKLLPVAFSSRHYDFKRAKWVFGKAGDQETRLLLERKIFWQTRTAASAIWVADPTDALYVENTPGHLLELAVQSEREGMITLQGEYASAGPALMARWEQFEADRVAALQELERKHEFERG
ncbi:MAG TPA: hypothetical protein VFJ47_14340, partial [Terriglobales bacterium]|nr:hypothetical protein [Terriglobales bacterium]